MDNLFAKRAEVGDNERMKIRWNKYTWYSKLAAAIFFIAILPVWTFYIGIKYEDTKNILKQAKITNEKLLQTCLDVSAAKLQKTEDFWGDRYHRCEYTGDFPNTNCWEQATQGRKDAEVKYDAEVALCNVQFGN